MKFEVGDMVLLLHSEEEGIVVDILSDEMVTVNVQGTNFPVYIDQLDFPYFKRFTSGKLKIKKKKIPSGDTLPREKPLSIPKEEKGVFLSFLPVYDPASDEPVIQTLKIHLMNETSLSYQFHYHLYLNEELELEIKNTLSPFAYFYLNDLPFEALNDHPRFEIKFSLTEPEAEKAEQHTSLLKMKVKQVIRKLEELQEKQDATFSYLLFEKYPKKSDTEQMKWDFKNTFPSVKYINKSTYLNKTNSGLTTSTQYEVDLHIEKLSRHPETLTPTDMIDLQLAELHRMLDQAIANRQFSMVVIHGIGKGTLRSAVHEVLNHIPEVKSFVNQHDIRYGYGATEIFFEYK